MLDLTMDDGRDLREFLSPMREGKGKEYIADKIHFLNGVVGVEIGKVKEYARKGDQKLHCIGFLFDETRFSVEGVKGLFYEVPENNWKRGQLVDEWSGIVHHADGDLSTIEILRVDRGISVVFTDS